MNGFATASFRPSRQVRPTVGTAAAGAVAFLAWRGAELAASRLGVFVAVAAVAAVLLDLVWAAASTRRARVVVRPSSSDTVAGDPWAMTISLSGAARLELSFEPSRPVWFEDPGDRPYCSRAPIRGVHVALRAEVTSRGLCGLAGFARTCAVPLDRALFVGPRPEAPADAAFPERPGGWGEGAPAASPAGDAVRGVRDYIRGDPLRHVHWRASARRGDLVVKQVEEPAAPRLDLVLDLGAGGSAGERAAGRAAWYAAEAQRRGYALVLWTAEPEGPVAASAASAVDANRRLAAAVGGPTGAPPPGAGAVLRVTAEGDRWG